MRRLDHAHAARPIVSEDTLDESWPGHGSKPVGATGEELKDFRRARPCERLGPNVFVFSAELRARIARELERPQVRASEGPKPARQRPPARACSEADTNVVVDLPNRLPPLREELAVWRAFLSAEIDAILRDCA
jgi:hypothetical protein